MEKGLALPGASWDGFSHLTHSCCLVRLVAIARQTVRADISAAGHVTSACKSLHSSGPRLVPLQNGAEHVVPTRRLCVRTKRGRRRRVEQRARNATHTCPTRLSRERNNRRLHVAVAFFFFKSFNFFFFNRLSDALLYLLSAGSLRPYFERRCYFSKKEKNGRMKTLQITFGEKRSLKSHSHQQSILNILRLATPFPQPAQRTLSTRVKRCPEGSRGLRACERQQALSAARVTLARRQVPGGLDAASSTGEPWGRRRFSTCTFSIT